MRNMSDNPLSGQVSLDITNFKGAIAEMFRSLAGIQQRFAGMASGMSNAASGIGSSTQQMGEKVKAGANRIRDLQSWGAKLARTLRIVLVGALIAVGVALLGLVGKSGALQAVFARLGGGVTGFGKILGGLGGKLKDVFGSTAVKTGVTSLGKGVGALAKIFAPLLAKSLAQALFKMAGYDKETNKARGSTNHLGNAMRSLSNHVRSAANGIGGMVTKVAKLAAGLAIGLVGAATAAGAAIIALAASTIAPASNLSETVSKVGVVFDASAERVLEFGKRAALAVGMSENAALSAAGTYGNLFRSMGIGSDASADMSINLVKLAGDLASFNNLSPDEVLEKLRAGLTGEAEPLKTLGVNINEATIKAKAMELGLLRAGEEMNAAAKAQAAYALIFEQTALAQGDFARTSGGLANQQRIWAAQVENLKAKIGAGLVPALASILTLGNELLASDAVQNWAGNLAKSLEKVGTFIGPIRRGFATGGITKGLDAIGETFKTMFPILNVVLGPLGRIIGYISDLIGIIQGADSVSGAAEGIGGLIAKIFGDTATARTNMATTAVSFISGFVDGIVGALPQLATLATTLLMAIVNGLLTAIPILIPVAITIINLLVQFLIQNLPMLITAAVQLIVTLAKGISEALPKLIPEVAKIIPVIILALIENLPMLVEAALDLIIALAEGLIIAIPLLLEAVPEIMTALINAIVLLWPKIKKAGEDLIKTVVDGVTAAWPKMQESGKKIGNIFLDGVKENIAKFLQIGKDIVSGVWDGIKERTTWFTDQVTGFFSGIVDAVKKTLGISSPSKVFSGIGENMALGLGSGFSGAFRQIERDVQGAIAGMSAIPSPSLSLAGGGIGGGRGMAAAPLTINVPVQAVNNEIDYYRLGRIVADVIQKER